MDEIIFYIICFNVKILLFYMYKRNLVIVINMFSFLRFYLFENKF